MAHNTIILSIVCLFVIPSVSPALVIVKVKLGDGVIFPCDGSAYRETPGDKMDVLWQTADGERVAHYSRGVHSVGLHFDGRVEFLTEKITRGNFSLYLSFVVYRDEDKYECVWSKGDDSERILRNVRLQVLKPILPTSLSVSAGDPVTLPCYGHINKTTPGNELFVQWKRGEEVVLQHSSGELTYGTEFNGRASMSEDRIQQGNFSLSLSVTGLSDQGAFQCSTERNQIGSVNLILEDHHIRFILDLGMSFNLHLPKVPVKVLFTEGGSDHHVCLVDVYAKCNSGYNDGRVTYKDNTLTIHNVRSSDGGRYTVLENNYNITIREIALQVVSPPPQGLYAIVLFVSACLLLLVMKKLRCTARRMCKMMYTPALFFPKI